MMSCWKRVLDLQSALLYHSDSQSRSWQQSFTWAAWSWWLDWLWSCWSHKCPDYTQWPCFSELDCQRSMAKNHFLSLPLWKSLLLLAFAAISFCLASYLGESLELALAFIRLWVIVRLATSDVYQPQWPSCSHSFAWFKAISFHRC